MCDAVLDRLRADGDVPASRVDRDAERLFDDTVPMRAMSAMRGQARRIGRSLTRSLRRRRTSGDATGSATLESVPLLTRFSYRCRGAGLRGRHRIDRVWTGVDTFS